MQIQVLRGPVAGRLLCCCTLLTAFSAFALSQAAAPAKPAMKPSPTAKPGVVHITPADGYGKLLSLVEGEFLSAAEAMPEDKFNFAPPAGSGNFDGVRTFGQQVKHVAGSNYFFFGGGLFRGRNQSQTGRNRKTHNQSRHYQSAERLDGAGA